MSRRCGNVVKAVAFEHRPATAHLTHFQTKQMFHLV